MVHDMGRKLIFIFGKNVCIINNNITKLIKNVVTKHNFILWAKDFCFSTK